MTGCASCNTDDELLFTCSHCRGRFCAAHQFPHHACSRFSRSSEGDRRVVHTTVGVNVVEESTDTETEPADNLTELSKAPEGDQTTVPGPRVELARDAARKTRPDREGPAPAPQGRGMPWERGDASITTWMREQSYPSYLAKVGGLSLLLTTAYYGGLAVVLYGYI